MSQQTPASHSDADLMERTRGGDADAFGHLWRRHHRAALTVARNLTSSLEADDLVQEAYTRIYQSIVAGGGPTGSFRAYLFTSIRHIAAEWGRSRRESAREQIGDIEDPATGDDADDAALDRSLTHRAFSSLPRRWQEVLWYSEVEQLKPAEIAPILDMKPTAVAQLTFRAREGLREAWIQAHLREIADGSQCQWTMERLGAYCRGNIGRRDRGKVDMHLAGCGRCTVVATEAEEVSGRLALVLLPLALGATGAAGYLAGLHGGAMSHVTVAGMPSSVLQGAVAVPAGAVAGPAAAGGAVTVGAGVGAPGVAAGGGVAGAAATTAAAAGAGAGAAGIAAGAAASAGGAAAVIGGGAAVGALATTSAAAALGAALVVGGVVAAAVLPAVAASPAPEQRSPVSQTAPGSAGPQDLTSDQPAAVAGPGPADLPLWGPESSFDEDAEQPGDAASGATDTAEGVPETAPVDETAPADETAPSDVGARGREPGAEAADAQDAGTTAASGAAVNSARASAESSAGAPVVLATEDAGRGAGGGEGSAGGTGAPAGPPSAHTGARGAPASANGGTDAGAAANGRANGKGNGQGHGNAAQTEPVGEPEQAAPAP
jgi:RNA polymerase sigma factor (sigma-70 family)